MQRRARFVGIAMVALLAVAGCAEKSDDPGDSGSQPTASGTPTKGGNGGTDQPGDGTVIQITFNGNSVDPNGKQIEVPVNEPITLKISADVAGELHVHTQPEQEIAYPAGDSSHELTLDRPGVYEVESHDLDKIVVELEAS